MFMSFFKLCISIADRIMGKLHLSPIEHITEVLFAGASHATSSLDILQDCINIASNTIWRHLDKASCFMLYVWWVGGIFGHRERKEGFCFSLPASSYFLPHNTTMSIKLDDSSLSRSLFDSAATAAAIIQCLATDQQQPRDNPERHCFFATVAGCSMRNCIRLFSTHGIKSHFWSPDFVA